MKSESIMKEKKSVNQKHDEEKKKSFIAGELDGIELENW